MAFKRKQYHKEEKCLNCGYPLIGNYCAQCGQKAFLHKDSFLHMAIHFVADYFHYDNKFWLTIKTLFTKPGLVTVEFTEGKRAKYLNPLQLYIFVTTLFFLLVLVYPDAEVEKRQTKHKTGSLNDFKDTISKESDIMESKPVELNFRKDKFSPNNLHEYDSLQAALPAAQKDNPIQRHFERKFYIYEEKYKDAGKFNEIFQDKMFHGLSKVFFVLLPYFALLLMMVNFRKRIYYIDHLVFSIHFHAVLFFSLFVGRIIYIVTANEGVDGVVTLVILGGMLVYLFISFRKVYPTGFFWAFVKLFFLFLTYIAGLTIAMAVLALVIFDNM